MADTMTRTTTGLPQWTIGDRLAKARAHAGLDQDALAGELGIHRRSVSRYENQERPPRSVVLSYALVTGVPVWWLEGGQPPGDTVTRHKRASVTEIATLRGALAA